MVEPGAQLAELGRAADEDPHGRRADRRMLVAVGHQRLGPAKVRRPRSEAGWSASWSSCANAFGPVMTIALPSRALIGSPPAARDRGLAGTRSQLPPQRPVGLVAAKGSRVDRVLEVPCERRVLLADPLDGLADAAGDGLAGPIRDVAGLARPPAEPEGGGKLLGPGVDRLAYPGGQPLVG